MSGGYGPIASTVRKEIEAAIRKRLEDKADRAYGWSSAAAADEASYAVMEWLESEGLA